MVLFPVTGHWSSYVDSRQAGESGRNRTPQFWQVTHYPCDNDTGEGPVTVRPDLSAVLPILRSLTAGG